LEVHSISRNGVVPAEELPVFPTILSGSIAVHDEFLSFDLDLLGRAAVSLPGGVAAAVAGLVGVSLVVVAVLAVVFAGVAVVGGRSPNGTVGAVAVVGKIRSRAVGAALAGASSVGRSDHRLDHGRSVAVCSGLALPSTEAPGDVRLEHAVNARIDEVLLSAEGQLIGAALGDEAVWLVSFRAEVDNTEIVEEEVPAASSLLTASNLLGVADRVSAEDVNNVVLVVDSVEGDADVGEVSAHKFDPSVGVVSLVDEQLGHEVVLGSAALLSITAPRVCVVVLVDDGLVDNSGDVDSFSDPFPGRPSVPGFAALLSGSSPAGLL